MEIIKEIKEAEKQAKQIVDEAHLEAQKIVADARLKREKVLGERGQSRRDSIERAENDAVAKAGNEAKNIEQQALKSCEQIGEAAKGAAQKGASKVVEFIKQMA